MENGTVIDDVTIAVQRWGELSPNRDNVVVVLHALTGDSHVTGPAGPGHPTPGWWEGVAGPGAPIDTDRWCVVATNVLGGCRGLDGSEVACTRWKAVGLKVSADLDARPGRGGHCGACGAGHHRGRRGGRRLHGRRQGARVDSQPPRRGALSAGVGGRCRATADQIGTQSTQIAAIKSDPDWCNGDYYGRGRSPDVGMEIARRFAHLTYRGEVELDTGSATIPRATRTRRREGRYSVQSYLEHQGRKILAASTPVRTWP